MHERIVSCCASKANCHSYKRLGKLNRHCVHVASHIFQAGLTMLMRAVDVGNAEAVVMIRNHCSFDPAKSERNQHQQTVFHLINDRNL